MITKQFLIRVAGVFLMLGLIASPARADLLDTIMRNKEIRIGTDMGVPPAGMLDAQLKPVGSDVETAELLAHDWGLKLKFVPTTGATRIPNLLGGKADVIISLLSITPDRAKVIDFSKPYRVLLSAVGGPKDVQVSSIEGLKGMTVAATRGTTQDTMLTALAPKYGFQVVRYEDDATTITAAVTGQVKLVAIAGESISTIAKRKNDPGFGVKFALDTFNIAVGIHKDEPRLLEKLNAWIAANLKNGKLNAIYKKYYGVDLPAAFLR